MPNQVYGEAGRNFVKYFEERVDMLWIYSIEMLYMKGRTIATLDQQIEQIKLKLQNVGPMRPGSLTKQYRLPQQRVGPYYQLSYTHQMKGHTRYVRPQLVSEVRRQIAEYKKFRDLTSRWVTLSIARSQLAMKLVVAP